MAVHGKLTIPFVLLTILSLSLVVVADPPAFNHSQEFDSGRLGLFVELPFQSTDLKAPQINFERWGPDCAESHHKYFFTPRGMLVGPVGPVILDRDGHMIWHRQDFGNTYNLQAQIYKGSNVLTFWAGDDTVVGHGAGFYYMFDDSYRQIRKIEALNGLKGDLHEFTVTRDDTALLSVYEQIPADLGYYERQPDGWIWDCHFQEVDLETNQLRFSWRASEHFRFQDTFNDVRGDAGAEHNAFDWFHINSVQKDDRGNYIVSARYSHAVSYIDGKTGDILWHLGGKNNSFQDLSGGNATNFAWQHDARWHDDYTTISIFDNAAYFGDDTHPARGMKVKVDTNAMTAELMQEYRHPGGYISESQGSMQVLDGGNVFLGYGSAPAFTEFSPDGRVLCDVSFGALHWREDGSFSPGAVMSYRAYKADWTGRPSENPKVKFQDGTFYVSWNGATEVRTWKLQGRSVANPQALKSDWRDVGSCDWQGFESSMKVETDTTEPQAHLSYRLSASDGQNKTLGIWEVQTDGTVTVHAPREPSASNTAGYAFVAFASAVIGFLIYRCKGNRGILARQRPTPALGVMGTTIALFQRLISPGDHKQNGWAWSRQARRKDRMSPKSPSMENLRLELRSSEDEGEELEGRVDGVRRRSPVRSWVV